MEKAFSGSWLRRGAREPLFPLLILAAVMATLWALAVPPWRPNDEPQHFGYIQYLSRHHSVPYTDGAFIETDVVISHNTTNFFGMVGKKTTTIDPNTAVMPAAAGDPPLYYTLMLPAFWASSAANVETQLYIVRIFGSIIFVLLVAAAYRLAGLVFPRKPYFQIAVPLLLIFQPQLLFIFTSVTNDGLVALLFTLLMYQIVSMLKSGLYLRRALTTGLILGLGMLTKVSFLLAFPLVLAAMAFLFVKQRGRRRRLAALAVAMLTVSVAVCGWYFLRNYLHGAMSPNVADPTKGLRYGPVNLRQLLMRTDFNLYIIATFVGTFSYVPLPGSVFAWFKHGIQLASIGLLVSLVAGRWRRDWETMRPWLVLVLGVTVGAFFLSAAEFELTSGSAQGRYLFPAIVPFWCLFLAGLAGFVPPRWRARATAVVVAVAAFFGVWALMVQFMARAT